MKSQRKELWKTKVKKEKLASSFSFFPHTFQISKNGSHPIPKIEK
jgi:hypothetical protein